MCTVPHCIIVFNNYLCTIVVLQTALVDCYQGKKDLLVLILDSPPNVRIHKQKTLFLDDLKVTYTKKMHVQNIFKIYDIYFTYIVDGKLDN